MDTARLEHGQVEGAVFPSSPDRRSTAAVDFSSAWNIPQKGLALGARAPGLSVHLRGRLQEAGSSCICCVEGLNVFRRYSYCLRLVSS